jgi:hypothetical protein
VITKLTGIGANPYDALLTGDGRTYIVGLFGEKGLTAVDLWQDPPKVTPLPARLRQGPARSAGLQDAASAGLDAGRRRLSRCPPWACISCCGSMPPA